MFPLQCFSDILLTEQAYENTKKSKKAMSTDRAEQFKTGGGTFMPTMDEVDTKVIALLGSRATPLMNPFDSSSEYCSQGALRH